MREIKFRAWDISAEKHCMLGPYDITDSIWNYKEVRSLKLMQYTGLKDKNGKEIYEGDILKGLFATGGGGGNSTRYKEFNFSFSCHISKSSSQFGIDMPKNYGIYRFHPYIPQCEIIGNIYENPNMI